MLAVSVAAQISYLEHGCYSCYVQDSGRYCLENGRYDYGTCCNTQSPTFTCENQGQNQFCVSRATITNGIIGDYACPANAFKCPSIKEDVEVSISEMNQYYEREWIWN